MRTAGIDLATQPGRTAVCTIDWTPESAAVRLVRDRSDASLIQVCRTADKTGIDCPFGWPQPFVAAVQGHADRRPWPGRHRAPDAFRAHLSLRETDREVHRRTRCVPLSVAADRIGLTALRCALLLDELDDVDRTGITGPVAEVYPAASLRTWGLPWTGYKRRAARDRLPGMLAELARLVPWLSMEKGTKNELQTDDNAFDAIVCALTARTVLDGRTHHPTPVQAPMAAVEGWIHVPAQDSPVIGAQDLAGTPGSP